MRDIVVFGAGQIAELAEFYFRNDSEHVVVAFCVDSAFLKQDSFCGKPVVALEELTARFAPEAHGAFAAVSYTGLNSLRAQKAGELAALGYPLVSYVSSRATLFPGTVPGANAFILENNTIQPFVRIGQNVTLWSGNHIGHHSVIEDDVFIASQVVVSGNCHVGARSFIGVNATLRDGITVGARSIIGMGACLAESCDEESVFAAPRTAMSPVRSSKIRKI